MSPPLPPLSLMLDAQVGGRRKKEKEKEENWRESMSRIFGMCPIGGGDFRGGGEE